MGVRKLALKGQLVDSNALAVDHIRAFQLFGTPAQPRTLPRRMRTVGCLSCDPRIRIDFRSVFTKMITLRSRSISSTSYKCFKCFLSINRARYALRDCVL